MSFRDTAIAAFDDLGHVFDLNDMVFHDGKNYQGNIEEPKPGEVLACITCIKCGFDFTYDNGTNNVIGGVWDIDCNFVNGPCMGHAGRILAKEQAEHMEPSKPGKALKDIEEVLAEAKRLGLTPEEE